MKIYKKIAVGLALLLGKVAISDARMVENPETEEHSGMSIEEYCHMLMEEANFGPSGFDDGLAWEQIDIVAEECDNIAVPNTNPTVGDENGHHFEQMHTEEPLWN